MIQTLQGRSDEVNKLIAALAKAQGAIVAPERNKTVKVTPRSGGASYTFKYATLNSIIEAIRKPFTDNGLWFTQVLTFREPNSVYAGHYRVETTLFHESGQFISSDVPLIVDNVTGNQQFGSALTYMKRYALSALIGIAAEEDDDGNIADGNEVKQVSEKSETAGKNKTAPVAPDPIAAKPKVSDPSVNTGLIEVPLLPDESASDWMTWGKRFIDAVKSQPTLEKVIELQKHNAMPLKNMEIQVPKMFSNMMIALIRTKQELEKVNGHAKQTESNGRPV